MVTVGASVVVFEVFTLELQSILSEMGKKMLVVNNYKFGKAHVFKCVKIRWRCVQRTCSSKIYTGNDEITIMEADLQHNHEAVITLKRQIVFIHIIFLLN